jgi:hypothetical protein
VLRDELAVSEALHQCDPRLRNPPLFITDEIKAGVPATAGAATT